MIANNTTSRRPNIVLLVMDSVRAANLSCYGYHRPTTPNIDALAKEATLYEQAISVGCWTLPVHASLFTGLYPLNHGITISRDALPADHPTLARQLKEHGYQTACFSNNPYVSSITGLAAGFDRVEDLWNLTRRRGHKRTPMGRLIRQLEKLGPAGRPAIAAARLLQRARGTLKRRRNQRDSGATATNQRINAWLNHAHDRANPFFMFVNYMECHEPYNPPHPFDRKFMPDSYSPWRVARVGNHRQMLTTGSEQRRQENLEIVRALYDGELNYLDSKLGELVESLRARNLLENTLLIVTSDHGDSLGEHGQLGHRMTLFEQLVRVPLIVRLPGRLAAGDRVGEHVQLIDLYATCLDAAGLGGKAGASKGGTSLLAAGSSRKFTVAENTAPKSQDSVVARMVRTDRYKYIWKSNDQHELYDLAADPDESHNVLAAERETASRLERELKSWQQSLQSQTIEVAEVEYDAEVLARLRDLGYVD